MDKILALYGMIVTSCGYIGIQITELKERKKKLNCILIIPECMPWFDIYLHLSKFLFTHFVVFSHVTGGQ